MADTASSNRWLSCFKSALPPALRTAWWVIKISVSVSFAITILNYFNVWPVVAQFVAPLFAPAGLPGDAVLVFITGIFTNIYTVVAMVSTLNFSIREATIVAVMCLIAHNLIVETAVQQKSGSHGWWMVVLRLSVAYISALLMNLILPEALHGEILHTTAAELSFWPMMEVWLWNTLKLCVKMTLIITALMYFQRLMESFGVLWWLCKVFSPLMTLFGLPASTTFLWLVGNVVGLAYGGAILSDTIETGINTREEGNILNHHLAISHSQLEDPLLFVGIGLPYGWIIIPRLVLAVLVVWLYRLFRLIKPLPVENTVG